MGTTDGGPDKPDRLRVELGDRSYDILVGDGLIGRAGPLVAKVLRQPRVVVVTDRTVADRYLTALKASLDAADIQHEAIVLPPGEETKRFTALQALVERLLTLNVDRSTAVVALGGGVIGDIAGFAASITLRGLDLIQIPTTLLAQVDSSVGGKTGINTAHGKNLVGSFHQPRLVLADIRALDTLPPRELLAGYAEVAKYGFIQDAAFFAWLERNGPQVRDGDAAARRRAVRTSCATKAAVVAADEREAGQRALLNFGHTFGHAIEADVQFGPEVRHGEAVAIGMVMAFDLSVHLGLCPSEDAARARRHLASIGLPTDLRALARGRAWNTGALVDHMRRDKKVRDGKISFVLARGIGDAFIATDVNIEAVRDLLDRAIAA